MPLFFCAALQVAADYLSAVRSSASLSAGSSLPQAADGAHQEGFAGPKGQSRIEWEAVFQRGIELAEGPSKDHFLHISDLSNADWVALPSQVCTRYNDSTRLLLSQFALSRNANRGLSYSRKGVKRTYHAGCALDSNIKSYSFMGCTLIVKTVCQKFLTNDLCIVSHRQLSLSHLWFIDGSCHLNHVVVCVLRWFLAATVDLLNITLLPSIPHLTCRERV